MFGQGETYQGLGSASGMSGASGFEVSTSLGSGFRSSGSSAYSNNSSRVSDQTYRGFASGVMTTSYRGNGVEKGANNRCDAFASSKGTASFWNMHKDVANRYGAIDQRTAMTENALYYMEREEDDDTPAIGQEQPIGDMLVPMLLMAIVYLFVRKIKNCKKLKSIHQS
jgi:hypothetical protein